MIDFAKKSDVDGIIDVWQEAFGDTKEDILSFLNVYIKDMLVYKTDGNVVGITAMMSVSLNEKKGRYIYAVATKKANRGQGIAGKLVEFVNDYVNRNNEHFSVLVPQNRSLFDYYKRFGYEEICCLDTIKTEGISKVGCKVSKISANEYKKRRMKYFDEIIEWEEADLENIRVLSGGEFLEIKEPDAVAFAVKTEDELIVKELLAEDEKKAVNALGEFYKLEKVTAKICGNEPFAMIYPKEYKSVYFNIAID